MAGSRRLWLGLGVALGLPSLGCELGSFFLEEVTRPPLRFELDQTEFSPGDPVVARIILAPQPGVSYTFAITDGDGVVAVEVPIAGRETVTLSAPGPGRYDAQIRADDRMAAQRRIVVREP